MASLIFWLLIVVLGIKYAGLVLKADHRGEGGSFALLGILEQFTGKRIKVLSFLLMFAAGLLFGEGIITPAISVLSAVEGLKVVSAGMEKWIVPITVCILFLVFFFQRGGTRRIGKIYGPVMLLWFVTIALLGAVQIVQYPEIIPLVLSPMSAVALLESLSAVGVMLLIGAVFLVLTGSEALYADLGHLGKRAIRVGWFGIVFPSLVLSYTGQASYLLGGNSVRGGNLFYSIVPEGLLIPVIILATFATIIASVALIFGAYSLVSQAIAMHLLPRLRIVHTNREAEGQIYIPMVNWALFAGSVLLVLGFGSSTRLAAAYGFAVSGVMMITSIAMVIVATHYWKWPKWMAGSVFGFFCLLDFGFVVSNSIKFFEGGYIPLFLGIFLFLVIALWRWGRGMIRSAYDAYTASRDMAWFLDLKRRIELAGGILKDDRLRWMVELDRAAVFLISRPIKKLTDHIPVKLRVYLKRRGAIPKNILLLNIDQDRVPYAKHQYHIISLGCNVYSIHARFGFMENPSAVSVLRDLRKSHIFEEKFSRCTIEVSEDEFIIDRDTPWFLRLRARLFRRLQHLSVPAYRYFGLTSASSSGLSKTVVPVHIGRLGVRVEIPEFALKKSNETIDPDTLKPTTIGFTRA